MGYFYICFRNLCLFFWEDSFDHIQIIWPFINRILFVHVLSFLDLADTNLFWDKGPADVFSYYSVVLVLKSVSLSHKFSFNDIYSVDFMCVLFILWTSIRRQFSDSCKDSYCLKTFIHWDFLKIKSGKVFICMQTMATMWREDPSHSWLEVRVTFASLSQINKTFYVIGYSYFLLIFPNSSSALQS